MIDYMSAYIRQVYIKLHTAVTRPGVISVVWLSADMRLGTREYFCGTAHSCGKIQMQCVYGVCAGGHKFIWVREIIKFPFTSLSER